MARVPKPMKNFHKKKDQKYGISFHHMVPTGFKFGSIISNDSFRSTMTFVNLGAEIEGDLVSI